MSDEFDTLEEIADMRRATRSVNGHGFNPKARRAFYDTLARGERKSHTESRNWSRRKPAPITLPVIKAFDE